MASERDSSSGSDFEGPTAGADGDGGDDGPPVAPAARGLVDALPSALHSIERGLSESITSLEQSHVQISQSRPDSKLPSNVSQTTRNIMAKRALAQLDEVGAALAGARAELGRLRGAAEALRDECATLSRERDAALLTAERTLAESAALAQVSDASRAETSSRAEQQVRLLTERLEAVSAEARLLHQLNDKLRAESDASRAARDAAEARAASADAAARAAVDAAGGESGMRARDRSLLARLAAENGVFVAQLKRARAEGAALQARAEAAERAREEELALALSAQRDELQAALLADWGTSAQLEQRLAAERAAREATEAAAREEARLLSERAEELESALRESEARRSEAERALASALEEVGLVSAGMRKELHLAARADADARAARERLAVLEAREKDHAGEAAALREAARDALTARDAADARAAQLGEQLAGVLERERTGRRVAERLREEAMREHTRLLELETQLEDAQARVGTAERERELLSAQLSAMLSLQPRQPFGSTSAAGADQGHAAAEPASCAVAPSAAARAPPRRTSGGVGTATSTGAGLPEPLPL